MLIARTRRELAASLSTLGARMLVPTMGALHEGHLALVRRAGLSGPVVASIFVNPLQFGAGEDLARYPRDEAGDLALLARAGCALAFLPGMEAVYPPEDATVVEVAGPALGFEGERRPGHFRGVGTVVARLLGMVRPREAWFGEKDWQQLQVIRRMAADLCLGIAIEALPTVRETDGLALSSRNRFLTAAERAMAPELARLGGAAAVRIAQGDPVAESLAGTVAGLEQTGFAVDYVALVDGQSLVPLDAPQAGARLLLAARLGSVRLLDNFPI